ncbi:MAG: SDR family NAD(P)-dependent oxidoreductase [Candidatus Bipolaricaulia bacterium]
MSIPLQNQVAIVTGASSGIGQGIAEHLGACGASVVLAARREAELASIAERIQAHGSRAMPIQTDVTHGADVDALVSRTLEEHGRIDLLVNNAGVARHKKFTDLSMDDFEELFAVNVFGVVRCTQAVAPPMIEQEAGTIVNISSGAGFMGYAGGSAYCASKHAVNGFGKAVYDELRHHGVQVYTVGPGAVNTTMMSHEDHSPERQQMLQVADLSELVEFLATRERHVSFEPMWTFSRFRG